MNNAWYKSDRSQLPIVGQLKEWAANNDGKVYSQTKSASYSKYFPNGLRPISHYLLLPSPDWGVADLHLETIRPFIDKFQPTIGFSPVEASHAKKVTVIGGISGVQDSIIDGLLAAGCIVEQISGDGMNVAS